MIIILTFKLDYHHIYARQDTKEGDVIYRVNKDQVEKKTEMPKYQWQKYFWKTKDVNLHEEVKKL
jgi:hypothetical protein